VLFAGWLVANFQLAAISAGFDWTWFGRVVPESLILPMRKAGIAAYCLLTIALFGRLFDADLKQLRERWMLVPVQWSGVLLMVSAFVAPFAIFLRSCGLRWPSAWSVIAFLLLRILRSARSPVAMWYGASLALTLVSGLYEVLAAAFGLKVLIVAVNSVTAALASSLLAALAIAAQFRAERDKRVVAEAEVAARVEQARVDLQGDSDRTVHRRRERDAGADESGVPHDRGPRSRGREARDMGGSLPGPRLEDRHRRHHALGAGARGTPVGADGRAALVRGSRDPVRRRGRRFAAGRDGAQDRERAAALPRRPRSADRHPEPPWHRDEFRAAGAAPDPAPGGARLPRPRPFQADQ